MERPLHLGKTVSIGMSSRVVVIAHGRLPPSREDWEHVCKHIQENCTVARGQIVITDRQVPNAAQRKAALAVLPAGFVPPPAAILTDALSVRGAITALNWFLNDSQRAFRPNDAAGVAAHLAVTLEQARELIAFAHALVPK